MRIVDEDRVTITIQFTREEATHLRAALNYVASLFDYLDREALDGWRMTSEDAERLVDDVTNLTASSMSGRLGSATASCSGGTG